MSAAAERNKLDIVGASLMDMMIGLKPVRLADRVHYLCEPRKGYGLRPAELSLATCATYGDVQCSVLRWLPHTGYKQSVDLTLTQGSFNVSHELTAAQARQLAGALLMAADELIAEQINSELAFEA